MNKYIFLEHTIEKNFNIIFLCGVEYKENDKKDKRKVLKDYLTKLDSKNNVIILEENFIFGKSNKKYLAYDEIFMTDLNSAETLTALFSDFVFIIHESNSTAAEIGIFATNEFLKGKICLLVPDRFSVEEEKISSFFSLAFFENRNDINIINFYPSTEVWRSSSNKSSFRTYFNDNKIGENLSENIKKVLNRDNNFSLSVKIIKSMYKKHFKDLNTISYYYNNTTKKFDVRISIDILKWQIISLFNIEDFKTEIRKEKTINAHVAFVEKYYKNILKNTLEEKENSPIDDFSVLLKGTTLSIRNVIAYLLYLLQAMKKIEIIQEHEDSSIRKIRIDNDFRNLYEQYSGFITSKKDSVFGGIINGYSPRYYLPVHTN